MITWRCSSDIEMISGSVGRNGLLILRNRGMNVKKLHQTFAENVRMFMTLKEWTTVTLAKEANLPQKTVWTISRGTSSPTINKAATVTTALNVSLLACCAEGINSRQLEHSVKREELFFLSLGMTPTQYDTVLALAKSF
jgi:transcriptional regulator with XRE-family HTH domain